MKSVCQALFAAVCILSPTIARAGDPGNQRRTTAYRPAAQQTSNPTLAYRSRIVAAGQAASRPAHKPVMKMADRLKAAKAAFRIGHTDNALSHANTLLEQMPNDSNLLQFRSMIHFRKRDFRRASSDAYEAIQHGPVWNASIIESLYAYPVVYKRELRSMRKDSITDLQTLFLSAYHHLVAGELEQGCESLRRVLAIRPDDKVAIALIQLIETRENSNQ